jgi:hypothetical protein
MEEIFMSFIQDDEFVIAVDHLRNFEKEDMSKLRSIGIKTIATYFGWHEGETRPGEYNFEPIQKYIEDANSLGIKIMLAGGYGTPLWAPEYWFMKNQYGQSNGDFEFIKNINPKVFEDIHMHMVPRMPSYWCEEACELSNKFQYKMGQELHQDNLFFICMIGRGNEFYLDLIGDHLYAFDDLALKDFSKFLFLKYKDNLDRYNFIHESNYLKWNEITPLMMRNDNFCYDTIEWLHSSFVNRLFTYSSIMKQFNPTNEQFLSSVLIPWTRNYTAIFTGNLEPLMIMEYVRKKLDIEIINEIRWLVHDTGNMEGQFETAWQTKKYGYHLWTGAEGPENIVNNTRRAMRMEQRGFVCGKVKSWESIDYEEVKKSLDMWKVYYPR